MTCVIVDHSKLSSFLTWFSYERFWVVSAAEVFIVLSGTVLGATYCRKLARGGWPVVVRGLGRRALTLYLALAAVTISVVLMSLVGIDVRSLTMWGAGKPGPACFVNPRLTSLALWRDVGLMRCGPWAFQIVGLYVWLVAAAVPCLLALRSVGWRPVLAASWIVYIGYRVAPQPVTGALFESAFPILAWQLLFVHGLAIGYYRESLSAFVSRCPRFVPVALVAASIAFGVFAFCNPWADGPAALHWKFVTPERFTYLYFQYFNLTDLRIGRVLNVAVALPVGYLLLTRWWPIARRFGLVFVTLGQQSLAAFVLHVYGILLLAHIPRTYTSSLWTVTLVQVTLVVCVAALLDAWQRWSFRRSASTESARPLAA